MKKIEEEFALNELKKYFNILGRIPTRSDFAEYIIRPERTYYIRRYGSIENTCVLLGLIEKPLSKEERLDISIENLKDIAKKLNKIPSLKEYEELKDNNSYSIFPLKKYLNMNYTEICAKYLVQYIDDVPNEYKRCNICKQIKLLNEFNNTHNSSCKLCEYIKRNDLIIPDGWTKEDCLIVIDSILNEKVSFLNDLIEVLPYKTLDDFINLLNNKIKIGNKPLNIKTYCLYCGKEEIKILSVFIKNKNYFCSSDCYWNYKREFEPKGEENYLYNRIKTKCTNCDKDIEVIPYDYNSKNKNGDNHNFCSQECYWEYRKKYYIGENCPSFGVEKTEQQKQNQRIKITKLYSDGVFKRLTKPQLAINNILDELNVEYIQEYNCKYYAIDNYLTEHNLMIEVMGDYFHANPLKFKEINEMQFKDLIRDKRKRTYIKKYKNINILYLWEKDIKNDLELVKKLILYYINNKGNIDYYDSFNYSFINDKLVKNDIIIKPYIDYLSEELKNIKRDKIIS